MLFRYRRQICRTQTADIVFRYRHQIPFLYPTFTKKFSLAGFEPAPLITEDERYITQLLKDGDVGYCISDKTLFRYPI